jgi:hypothetical protein
LENIKNILLQSKKKKNSNIFGSIFEKQFQTGFKTFKFRITKFNHFGLKKKNWDLTLLFLRHNYVRLWEQGNT